MGQVFTEKLSHFGVLGKVIKRELTTILFSGERHKRYYCRLVQSLRSPTNESSWALLLSTNLRYFLQHSHLKSRL